MEISGHKWCKFEQRKIPEFHLDGKVNAQVKRYFCTKTLKADDNNRPDWPPGGDKNDPILLPTKSPFFLLAYASAECQMVKWAVASLEWIFYDTEHTNNADGSGGAYPHEAGKKHPTIYYCYYRGPSVTTTQTPEVSSSYPVTKHTLEKTTTDGPSKEGGREDQSREKTQREGFNVVAVVVPVVSVVFLAAFFVAVFCYCKRMRNKNDAKPNEDSVRWPAGTYGIPKPASGCPYAEGFQWKEGWRSQDTDNTYSNNNKSAEFHLDGIVDSEKVNRSFCIKPADNNDRPNWPPGQYCIYKKGKYPTGLKFGYVFWDDENNNNKNGKGGTFPGGMYKKNTKIYFCCKTDGDKNDPILLPTKSPFFLLAYASAKCQMVKWAVASVEWIQYDTEHTNNRDRTNGTYPHEAGKMHPTIYYCYYRGCNETLTALNGTFQSPNYPRKYPDGQYCSWRITVNTTQQIHLMFTNFSLQNENNTDVLYVYDGDNATGEVLGVFYGGHPPPKEGIYSLSKHMFVIFKSDKTGSYTGFDASYYGVNISGPSVTTTQTREVTSSYPVTKHTLEKTTTDGPSKEGGREDQSRGKTQREGFNVVAVVVPVVMRNKKDAKPNEDSVRWPAGTYGIPKPASGCPYAEGFQWKEGWRSQDTDNTYSNNNKSAEFHLDGIVDSEKVNRSFCIKPADNNDRPSWPPGQYCIYKKGKYPTGLKLGYVFWDDENNNNKNGKGGTLPGGVYDKNTHRKNTKIYFCCKTDGDKMIPSSSPLSLHFSCWLMPQRNARWSSGRWLVWSGYIMIQSTRITATEEMERCNETLTALNGTFQSPNYPRKYPDGQYCSWRITVNTTQQIHLIFTNFSLQNENNTDELYVYDGENATGEVLGVF
ncbi:hypothetical protein OS493_029790 [Desmophyllum pertusum]|uniref:CUB domain-containing protein n=1 Tax=Desmophyllum pertusum TaxID=174260 RepID=A0A9X0CPE4_9CNID|nr:hypothetical protein OS493_029790 [Desmophyllum pertusum]